MSEKSGQHKTAEKHLRDIRCKTRRKFAPEENIRIVLEDLRGEYPFAELCHRALAHRQDQGLPEPKDGAGHGLQTDNRRRTELAHVEGQESVAQAHQGGQIPRWDRGDRQQSQRRRLISHHPKSAIAPN